MLLGSTLWRLGQSWGNIGAILEALRATWVFLRSILGHTAAILGHPRAILGLAWDNLGAARVQGHLVEMQKPLSLGPRAANTLAPEHASSTVTSCDMEHVDFTQV